MQSHQKNFSLMTLLGINISLPKTLFEAERVEILAEATRRVEAVVDVLSCNRLHSHSSQPGAGSGRVEVANFVPVRNAQRRFKCDWSAKKMTWKNLKMERDNHDTIHVLVILHPFISYIHSLSSGAELLLLDQFTLWHQMLENVWKC